MLFKISDNGLFEDNPELKAIPEFRALSEAELRYVVLFSDWAGPFRRCTIDDKKMKSLIAAGFTKKSGGLSPQGKKIYEDNEDFILKAVKAYKELQGWSEMEILEGIDSSLKRYNELLKDPKTKVNDRVKITKGLVDLVKQRNQIASLYEERLGNNEVPEDEEEVEEELSILDQINNDA